MRSRTSFIVAALILTAMLTIGGAVGSTPGPLEGASTVDGHAWIAYQTYRDGHEGIWLVRPDGTEDHEVATDVPGDHLHPDWSPDGTRLLFTSRSDKDLLYELDIESGQSRPLWDCPDPCLGDDEAVWSPDGREIAFVRAQLPFLDDAPADCALWLGDPATGEVERLTEAKSCWDRETFPHWSRDATRISYYRGEYDKASGEATASAVYVIDVATGTETKLTDGTVLAGDSDWSAGDEWLVFTTHPLNDFQCCVTSDLWRVHPDGTGLEQLTSYESVDERATQPRYLPDGSAILFTRVTPSDRDLWLVPADGGESTAITHGGIHTHGTWQPRP